ncbi:MAG TPA: ATPase, T2SS/T4P/T4SS family, partial [Candidatus Rifleibacterium sp.]|nr:ATPase, T2SS/T4P/T4SS family [Candidatus Rifleibacterium sp.]
EVHVIVVEEISDEETALECFKAANDGIIVLTQMHARNSSEVFRQLLNLKVPPFQLYDGIGAVVFQMLVRNVCSDCRRELEFTAKDFVRLSLVDFKPGRYSDSKGCASCRNSGYRGMHPFYEITVPNKNLKEAIIKGDSNQITLALEAMHGTCLEAKIRTWVEEGYTSPAEAARIRTILFAQS